MIKVLALCQYVWSILICINVVVSWYFSFELCNEKSYKNMSDFSFSAWVISLYYLQKGYFQINRNIKQIGLFC